jgi:hypothetical protein
MTPPSRMTCGGLSTSARSRRSTRWGKSPSDSARPASRAALQPSTAPRSGGSAARAACRRTRSRGRADPSATRVMMRSSVTDRSEQVSQCLEAVVRQQVGDCVQACLERLRITQGAVQPAPQQAAAHRRAAAVEDGKQRVRLAAGQVAVDLQIAPRRRIQHHAVLAALHGQGRNVRQVPALRVAHVAEQAAGGADCQGQVLAAEAAQVVGLELLAKAALRRLEVELPGRLGARPGTRRHGRVRELLVVEHLRGVEALELAGGLPRPPPRRPGSDRRRGPARPGRSAPPGRAASGAAARVALRVGPRR